VTPLIIALEGIDGSGTTTQARDLTARLSDLDYVVETLHQPSDGPIGTLIRQALRGELGLVPELAMALLFGADREMQRVTRTTSPVCPVDVVVMDRSYISAWAYQPPELATTINNLSCGIRPDLAILLRVSPAVAQARRDARGGYPERYDHARAQSEAAVRYARLFRERGWPVLSGELPSHQVTDQILGLVVGQLMAHPRGDLSPQRKAELRATQARIIARRDQELLEAAVEEIRATHVYSCASVARRAGCTISDMYRGRYSSPEALIRGACACYLATVISLEQVSVTWAQIAVRHSAHLRQEFRQIRARLCLTTDEWHAALGRAALQDEVPR